MFKPQPLHWINHNCGVVLYAAQLSFFILVAKLLIINLITYNDQYINIDLFYRSIGVSDSEESDDQLSDEEGD